MRRSSMFAKGRLLFEFVFLSFLTLAAEAAVDIRHLPDAVITYSFLGMHYPEVFHGLVMTGTTDMAREMKALDDAIVSLGCNDLWSHMWGSHRTFVVPSLPLGQRIGFEWTDRHFPPREGALFVTEPLGTAPARVWVIYSQVAPESTAVFWLEPHERGYRAGLVYDTFCKGKDQLSNSDDPINAIISVSIEKGEQIVLREWRGVRLNGMGARGGVFQVDTVRREVTMKSPAP